MRDHPLAQALRVVRGVLDAAPGGEGLGVPVPDCLDEVGWAREWETETKQLKEHNAATEDVCLWMNLALPDLRRHRCWGAHRPVELEVPRSKDLCHAQVNNHDVRILVDVGQGVPLRSPPGRQGPLAGHEHDVGGLQVEVDDAPCVDVGNGQEDLPHHVRHEKLGEVPAGLSALGNHALELPTGAEVHDEVDVGGIFEVFVKPHDVGMVQQTQVLDLYFQHFCRPVGILLLVDHLHSPLGTGRPAPRQHHQAEGALPQGPLKRIDVFRPLQVQAALGSAFAWQRLAEVLLHAPEQLPEDLAEALGRQRLALRLGGNMLQRAEATADAEPRVDVGAGGVHVLRTEQWVGVPSAAGLRMHLEERLCLVLEAAFAEGPSDPLQLCRARPCPRAQPLLLLLQTQDEVRLDVKLDAAGLSVHVDHDAWHPTAV
mmetsp:Transcript_91525/g.286372  ORF Transcript_91525/g.286372 Transcript_91525/m.286372 type:complete len:428 (-) Transcript_91525:463-1746(-)